MPDLILKGGPSDNNGYNEYVGLRQKPFQRLILIVGALACLGVVVPETGGLVEVTADLLSLREAGGDVRSGYTRIPEVGTLPRGSRARITSVGDPRADGTRVLSVTVTELPNGADGAPPIGTEGRLLYNPKLGLFKVLPKPTEPGAEDTPDPAPGRFVQATQDTPILIVDLPEGGSSESRSRAHVFEIDAARAKKTAGGRVLVPVIYYVGRRRVNAWIAEEGLRTFTDLPEALRAQLAAPGRCEADAPAPVSERRVPAADVSSGDESSSLAARKHRVSEILSGLLTDAERATLRTRLTLDIPSVPAKPRRPRKNESREDFDGRVAEWERVHGPEARRREALLAPFIAIENKIFRSLLALPRADQDLMAGVLAGWGEARGLHQDVETNPQGRAEMIAVIQSAQSRFETALTRPSPPRSVLDVVMQDQQFSFLNGDDPNWVRFFLEADGTASLGRAVRAYDDWATHPDAASAFRGGAGRSPAWHYIATREYFVGDTDEILASRAVAGRWYMQTEKLIPRSEAVVQVPPPPPGGSRVAVTGHRFYRGIAWSYSQRQVPAEER